jgi:hypothetical protein
MNKEQLQAAIGEMLDGMDSGNYHYELTMLLTVVDSTSEGHSGGVGESPY